MSNPAPGQLNNLSNSHHESGMSAAQCQDYIDLVISKADQLGEHYVSRQLTWACSELERLQLKQVRPNGPFVIQLVDLECV